VVCRWELFTAEERNWEKERGEKRDGEEETERSHNPIESGGIEGSG
jgi:hypothetical protein